MKNEDILVIADTQVQKGSDLRHLEALSVYIWMHKPKYIVHIGDHWDFPSLSTYASELEREGKRLKDDMKSGDKALDIIMEYTNLRNKIGKLGKKRGYYPEKYFLMGNHENRLNRFIASNPCLASFIDLNKIIEKKGWKVNEMCDPLWINNVCFNHYMENPMSGKAVGGSMENKLNKFPHSFVHGHQQQYQYARRQNLIGKPHFGVCAGAFYIEDEGYRGANNTEIRGFVHMKAFTNRYDYLDYDVEFVSLERLLQIKSLGEKK